MARKFKTMDGNNAAAYVSYAFTEVAGIYLLKKILKNSQKAIQFLQKPE